MVKRIKIEDKKIEKAILEILDDGFFRSISQITKELIEKKEIILSPQIIKRYLLKLEKYKKITRK